jgi:outer membrane receptor protein involved in Fe transport
MKRRSAWLLSGALIAFASPAFAQTAQSTTDTDKQTAQPTQGATAEAAAVQDQAREQQPIDTSDIVITATRRNEALSDVPMAVSAVTAQTLEYTGATDIRQLQQVSPSLLVTSTTSEAGAATARIRGIGTVGDNPGLEGSVATYIDGVYRSRTGVAFSELGPLDRIEVLRGPQGTLFGRNASAGVISIITAKPRFTPEVSGQVDVGNYSERRLEASATGPFSDTIAGRLDFVWSKRDGFLKDDISGRDVNDRNRWLVRGQMLFQPSDDFSFRLVGDYSHRDEECCAAVFLPAHDTTAAGPQPSTIAAIERALGAIINDDPFRRHVSITPGRNFDNRGKDGGVSGEAVYDMGWAELTSITAYRVNNLVRGQDADFNNLDILFRDDDGGYANRFKTFTQELRLQGNTWNNRLDWLVGGYYANEKLRARDNVGYGADFPRYANCLVAANFVSGGAPASLLAPGASPTCFNPNVAPLVQGGLVAKYTAAVNAGNIPLATAIAGQISALAAFARLNNVGFPGVQVDFTNPAFGNSGFSNFATAFGLPGQTLAGNHDSDEWNQTSNNWAIFTHNIFAITDQLKLTLGARYTHEKKDLNAALADNNALCSFFSAAIPGLQQLPCVFVPSVPGHNFHGSDSLTEGRLSGTVVLSYKPTDRLLTYASYSRGYKAGGFNMDRAALVRAGGNGAVLPQDNFDALIFKPETNDAFELGAKFNGRGIDVNFALFRQLFKNFQLNTFNGLNFVVENINSCSDDLNGADTDQFDNTGACTGHTRAGVRSQGFELEVFTRPIRDLAWNAGVTMADTKYRDNLVGANGEPLTAALFQLPGRRVSNAPKWTATSSVAWTPPIGGSGMRGLVYADVRYMSQYNTGSDLDIEKTQDSVAVVNGRIGLHGPDEVWGVELWAQNLFNKDYMQIAFDAPLQGTGTTRGVEQGFYPRATQLYGAFLAEPRTFGVTLRGKLGFARAAPAAYVPPPAPPPPVVEQPAPPPPPPPPPPTEKGERGE